MNDAGKKIVLFFIILIVICTYSSSILSEPFEGQLTNFAIAGGGRYIIASYTGPYIVVWDLDRLWDYHQPIQVHAFRGSARFSTSAMPIAASLDDR